LRVLQKGRYTNTLIPLPLPFNFVALYRRSFISLTASASIDFVTCACIVACVSVGKCLQ